MRSIQSLTDAPSPVIRACVSPLQFLDSFGSFVCCFFSLVGLWVFKVMCGSSTRNQHIADLLWLSHPLILYHVRQVVDHVLLLASSPAAGRRSNLVNLKMCVVYIDRLSIWHMEYPKMGKCDMNDNFGILSCTLIILRISIEKWKERQGCCELYPLL